MRALLLVVSFIIICLLTQHRAAALSAAQMASAETLYEWVYVDFNFTASPWGSREKAIEVGAYKPENSVITGLAHYKGTTYVCVPRWRTGVPATLARVVDPPNRSNNSTPGPVVQPVLEAWPSWNFNLMVNYVQSVRVDQESGRMFVIDAGRENFLDRDPSTLINGAAKLYILDIETEELLYSHTFSDEILPFNSSFLNDIVLDMNGTMAYMSDTNTAGLGAVVAHNWTSRHSFRFQDPESTYAQSSYKMTVLGVPYPNITSPQDGIAWSPVTNRVYYSPVQGDRMYHLDAGALSSPDATFESVRATVALAEVKQSFSDGLLYVPTRKSSAAAPMGDEKDVIVYGSNSDADLRLYSTTASFSTSNSNISDQNYYGPNNTTMQWVDTLCYVSDDAEDPFNAKGWVYFTTNRLQLWATYHYDWTGRSGANMRLFRIRHEP